MGKEVEVTLYYANWCGHCVTFKPEWQKFKKNIKDMDNKHKDVKIKVNEYEHSKLEKIGGGKINGEDISGYPTLKIKLTRGNESKEYDYGDCDVSKKEKRNATVMTEFIKNICNGLSE
jgi:hypothetical protein